MNFKEYYIKNEILIEFDEELKSYKSLNENHIGDLDIANVIMAGLDKIKGPNMKSIMSALAGIAGFTGKKSKDIMKLFSKEGIEKIRNYIDDDIIGSKEIKFITRKLKDPDRYQGFKGLQQFIKDMKEDDPRLMDSLKKAVDKVIS